MHIYTITRLVNAFLYDIELLLLLHFHLYCCSIAEISYLFCVLMCFRKSFFFILTDFPNMKTALSTCIFAYYLLFTINNNLVATASKTRLVLNWYRFANCCKREGCPFKMATRPTDCVLLSFSKNTISCKCIDVDPWTLFEHERI